MTRDTGRKTAIAGSIVLAHACVFALLSITHATPPTPAPVIDVELFSPILPPPPPPPPPPEPAPTRGGGAPAAPSVVHTPPPRPVARPEIVAPPLKAPEQPLIVGAAPVAGPTPGLGQGGTGAGTGDGDGDGPGSGAPPLILRGASQAEILPLVPPAARRARQSGRGSVSCVIRPDTRLEACRLVSETPAGFGFGDAALRIVPQYFRFRPPTTASGRAVEDYRVTVFVQFGRP